MYQVIPAEAYDAAIQLGLLSADEGAANYAGAYMYMGTDEQRGHGFKHVETREYCWTGE
jgi:hypothetical protein